MLDKQHVTPCMIEDVLEHDKTARQGYYVIHAVQMLVDANVRTW